MEVQEFAAGVGCAVVQVEDFTGALVPVFFFEGVPRVAQDALHRVEMPAHRLGQIGLFVLGEFIIAHRRLPCVFDFVASEFHQSVSPGE